MDLACKVTHLTLSLAIYVSTRPFHHFPFLSPSHFFPASLNSLCLSSLSLDASNPSRVFINLFYFANRNLRIHGKSGRGCIPVWVLQFTVIANSSLMMLDFENEILSISFLEDDPSFRLSLIRFHELLLTGVLLARI